MTIDDVTDRDAYVGLLVDDVDAMLFFLYTGLEACWISGRSCWSLCRISQHSLQ